MSAAPAIEDDDAGLARWAKARLRRQAELLESLAEAGHRLSLSIAADAASGDMPKAEAALAFSRASRVVRLCALAQERLIGALLGETPPAAPDSTVDWDIHWLDENGRPYSVRDRFGDPGGERADRGESGERPPSCERPDGERLEGEDPAADLRGKTLPQVFAAACHDLGLEPGAYIVGGSELSRPPPLAGEGDPEGVERACRAATAQTRDPPCAQPP
jgi:hypothetical protein